MKLSMTWQARVFVDDAEMEARYQALKDTGLFQIDECPYFKKDRYFALMLPEPETWDEAIQAIRQTTVALWPTILSFKRLGGEIFYHAGVFPDQIKAVALRRTLRIPSRLMSLLSCAEIDLLTTFYVSPVDEDLETEEQDAE
jgi:hypothetical protein